MTVYLRFGPDTPEGTAFPLVVARPLSMVTLLPTLMAGAAGACGFPLLTEEFDKKR